MSDPFPDSLVDLESMPATIGSGDFIPLKDGRQAEVIRVAVSGLLAGAMPSNLSELVVVTVQWDDLVLGVRLQATMPLNQLYEIYVYGEDHQLANVAVEVV